MFLTPSTINASSDTSTINFEGSSSISNLIWEPWFTDWRFTFDVIYVTKGVTTIEWNNQKDTLSPSESTNFEIELTNSNYNPELQIIVKGIKKSNKDQFMDKTVTIPIPSAKLPGHFETPKIGAPVVPFEIIGIPAELSLQARFNMDTEYEIQLQSKEMSPDTKDYKFSSNSRITHSYEKNNNVGGEFSLIRTGILSGGYLTLSAGLTVSTLPTPFSIDFGEIPFSTGFEYYRHNLKLCSIQSPIDIELTNLPSVINQSEQLTVQGTTNPKIIGGSLSLLIGGSTVSSINTDNQGSFETQWSSNTPGTFSVSVKASDSEYISESFSDSTTVRVNEIPRSSFSVSTPRANVAETVTFTDQSIDNDGNIVQWYWSFGDGQTSSGQNPSHEYEKSGTFTITLMVTDNDGAQNEYLFSGLVIEKTSIDIQIDSDVNKIQVGNKVELNGDVYPSFSNENIVIQVKDPEGTQKTYAVTLGSGKFNKEFELDVPGTWEMKALFSGNDQYSSSESNTLHITVEQVSEEPSSESSESSTSPNIESENSSDEEKEGGIPSYPLVLIVIGFFFSGIVLYWTRKNS